MEPWPRFMVLWWYGFDPYPSHFLLLIASMYFVPCVFELSGGRPPRLGRNAFPRRASTCRKPSLQTDGSDNELRQAVMGRHWTMINKCFCLCASTPALVGPPCMTSLEHHLGHTAAADTLPSRCELFLPMTPDELWFLCRERPSMSGPETSLMLRLLAHGTLQAAMGLSLTLTYSLCLSLSLSLSLSLVPSSDGNVGQAMEC